MAKKGSKRTVRKKVTGCICNVPKTATKAKRKTKKKTTKKRTTRKRSRKR